MHRHFKTWMIVGEFDVGSVMLGDRPHEAQPKPAAGAVAAGFQADEPIEYPFPIRFGNTWPAVCYDEFRAAVDARCGDVNDAAFGRIFNGIVEQIGERLGQ